MSRRNDGETEVNISGKVWRQGKVSLVFIPRNLMVICAILLLIIVLALFSMTIGKFNITIEQIITIFWGRGSGTISEKIIMDIRLPRVLTAIFVGAALGVSGAVFQSISRNALGSPDVIGFTTGAATGAILQIVLFDNSAVQVAIAAVAGGTLTAVVVYLLSLKSGAIGGYRLILTGIGVGSVLSALNGLLLVKGNLDNAVMANLWLAGSLNARTWIHVFPVLIGVVLLVPLVLFMARKLSIIEMGDDIASQLGIRVERVRFIMIFCAVVLAALATGAAGPIAFVALAAPQLVVRLTRSRNMPVISAALMGACLLLSADLLTQLLPLRAAVPIGLMTGLIGGIYLIWLLTRSRQI
ncbi:iron chelate uptake ABC transporter family permease subunit [Photorhabdus temperata]|uniref:ABC-type enterobactin transport system, permease component n=1 Tax=Photorhabdus temperata subsp. temperata Meg1 TaxID=1393735 RepID=A0A081S283_PHOTE|nr:iron chelate uptake ABC transporter family permease subunit [Photorhabdus temperata]KER05036.1 ABC-type enterobactin transport system, permease component [Photorhabdus temperata subsp. temperata Meg1]MCT8347470.1 iron chelate uptake ABC transporter family permease subunit [Photorhabdus temperata]